MNKLFAYALLSIGLVSCAELAQLPGLDTGSGGGLSNADVVAGLKEALVKGAQESTARSSAVDGFWQNAAIRIPFPPEAQQMKSTLVSIGLGSQVDKFELTLNRAAEEAAKEALPVLRDAVTSMTVADGFAILRGGDHAATNYLREKTSSALTARFKPIVQRATQKVALTSYWTPLANGYNQASILTGAKAVDPDLDAYVTQGAINGLFVHIAAEEARIRKDPLARTSDLLRRVFANQ